MTTPRRWLFADQLGPHFLDAPDQPVLLLEATGVFRRRVFHRRKAHLILSALRHLAAELGDQALVVRSATYRAGLAEAGVSAAAPITVVDPTTHAARRFVRQLVDDGSVAQVLPARGFAIEEAQFEHWAAQGSASRLGRGRLLMEDFYRDVRRHHRLLLDADGRPEGGAWNYDAENREPPPKRVRTLADADGAKGLPEPWWPVEDDIDAGVRDDLDRMARDDGVRFVGDDGPRRFAVTRAEALTALDHFVTHRLEPFGTYEDAMLAGDPWMSHSMLSATMNLGLLHPVEAAQRAERAYRDGAVRLASVEGYVRQLVGWRDYVWHLYWHLGEDYRARNALQHTDDVPEWFAHLDPDGAVEAACLKDVLRGVREEGWVHHIPRLMVLGNYALQRGWSPQQLTDWFHRVFVDGYDWVMVANVVGMSQHADGGVLATKPYWSGGAYIDRMSDYCGGCRYDPKKRLGEDACPFTAGYWAFTARHQELLAANPRTRRAVGGLQRLPDADAVVAQERERGSAAP